MRYQHLFKRNDKTFIENIKEIVGITKYKEYYFGNHMNFDIKFILTCKFIEGMNKPKLSFEELRLLGRRFSLNFVYLAT